MSTTCPLCGHPSGRHVTGLCPGTWHDDWVRRLQFGRATRDLNACLTLRRRDAEHVGFGPRTTCLSLLEEWRWHWNEYLGRAA